MRNPNDNDEIRTKARMMEPVVSAAAIAMVRDALARCGSLQWEADRGFRIV